MNEPNNRQPVTTQAVIYRIPAMQEVQVERDLEFRGATGASLGFDLYRPSSGESRSPTPAVVFICGFSDPGFASFVGCKFKEMAGYVTWAQLVAASGLAAITYTNQDPVADLYSLLGHLERNAASLGLDQARFGVWACSGNVPTALSLLMSQPQRALRSAVLCYGPMLDLPGSIAIAEAAARLGFANPCAGHSVADLASDVSLLIVRAGRETLPGLNASIDHFAAAALARNLPLTLVNHATAPHAFDLIDDTELSREMVRRILTFMRFHLLEASA